MKKITAFIIVLSMLICTMSHSVSAEMVDSSGKLSNSVYWALEDLDSTGYNCRLHIWGNGPIPDYEDDEDVPWAKLTRYIQEVQIDVGITEIGKYSLSWIFRDSTGAKGYTLTIPEGVTRIGERGLYSNDFVELNLPSTLEVIESSAFAYCQQLKVLKFPKGIKRIGYNAFYYCGELEEVYFNPDNIEEVNKSIFPGCGKIEKLYTKAETYAHYPICGIAKLYDIDTKKQIKELIIPYDITEIKEGAFAIAAGIERIKLHNRITKIGKKAFYNCADLRAINIPASVTEIGNMAFSGCDNLENVFIEDLEAYGKIDFKAGPYVWNDPCGENYEKNPIYYADNLYVGGISARELVMPSKYTCYTFPNLKNVESLVMRASFIDETGMTNIPLVLFGDGSGQYKGYVKNGNDVSFETEKNGKCYGDSRYPRPNWYLNEKYTNGTLTISGSGKLELSWGWNNVVNKPIVPWGDSQSYINLVIEEGEISEIPDHMFIGSEVLQKVFIPKTITNIGDDVFDYRVRDVYYAGTQEEWNQIEKVWQPDSRYTTMHFETTFGMCGGDILWILDNTGELVISGYGKMYDFEQGAAPWYEFREKIDKVTFEGRVTSIGSYAFEGLENIISVDLPESVAYMGENVFDGCSSLEVVNFENCIDEIESGENYADIIKDGYCVEEVVGLRTQSLEYNPKTKTIDIVSELDESTVGVAVKIDCIDDNKSYTTAFGNGVSRAVKDGYCYFVAKKAEGKNQTFEIDSKVGEKLVSFRVNVVFDESPEPEPEAIGLRTKQVDFDKENRIINAVADISQASAGVALGVYGAASYTTDAKNGINLGNKDGYVFFVAKKVNGWNQTFNIYVEKNYETITYQVNISFKSDYISDIATLRCYESSFNDDTKKITVNVDRFPVINKSGSLGVAIIPADGYTVSYNFTSSNGTTSGFSNTNTSKYTLLSSGVNTETTGGGALGNVPMKIFKKENSTRIYVDVVLTKGSESVTYKMTIALRDPIVQGDVDIKEIKPLRADADSFVLDNEAKTIYYETLPGVTSAGFAVRVDNDFTKATRPRRVLTAKSGYNLSHGDIKTEEKDTFDRYVVARRSAGKTQTYQVKVHGGKDGLTYSWYTVTVVFK